jgi:hypothetical protein
MIECLFFYSINDTFLRFQLLLSYKNTYVYVAGSFFYGGQHTNYHGSPNSSPQRNQPQGKE